MGLDIELKHEGKSNSEMIPLLHSTSDWNLQVSGFFYFNP